MKTCVVKGCGRLVAYETKVPRKSGRRAPERKDSRGGFRKYCQSHYALWCDGKPLHKLGTYQRGTVCTFPGCGRPYCAKGYCGSHYAQLSVGKALAPIIADRPVKYHKTRGGYLIRRIGAGHKFQHREIMEAHLSRELLKCEIIHHKNGQRDDNRIENLELCNNAQPPGQRVVDKYNWCKEFIAQYEKELEWLNT